MRNVLFIGGWGYRASALAPLLDATPEGFHSEAFSLAEAMGAPSPLPDLPPGAVLVGWSTGGLRLLEYLLQHPEREHPCVLVSTTAHFLQDEASPWGVPAANLRALRKGIRRDAASMLWNFHAQVLHGSEEAPALTNEDFENDQAALTAGLDYLQDTDLRPLLRSLPGPCTLLHGTEDRVIDVQAGRAVATACDCPCIEWPQAGHALPLLHPEKVWQAIGGIA